MTLRHFLADDDLTPAEQRAVLERALALKAAPFSDRCLEGPRTVSILFDKPTLRIEPALNIPRPLVDEVLEKLEETLDELTD